MHIPVSVPPFKRRQWSSYMPYLRGITFHEAGNQPGSSDTADTDVALMRISLSPLSGFGTVTLQPWGSTKEGKCGFNRPDSLNFIRANVQTSQYAEADGARLDTKSNPRPIINTSHERLYGRVVFAGCGNQRMEGAYEYDPPLISSQTIIMAAPAMEVSKKLCLITCCKNQNNTHFVVKSKHFDIISFGRTEVIDNTRNPDFVRKFVLDFFFEEKQNLRFDVYNVDSRSCNISKHLFYVVVCFVFCELVVNCKICCSMKMQIECFFHYEALLYAQRDPYKNNQSVKEHLNNAAPLQLPELDLDGLMHAYIKGLSGPDLLYSWRNHRLHRGTAGEAPIGIDSCLDLLIDQTQQSPGGEAKEDEGRNGDKGGVERELLQVEEEDLQMLSYAVAIHHNADRQERKQGIPPVRPTLSVLELMQRSSESSGSRLFSTATSALHTLAAVPREYLREKEQSPAIWRGGSDLIWLALQRQAPRQKTSSAPAALLLENVKPYQPKYLIRDPAANVI
ncbi:Copine-8 [Collichthys lucidus]|uniref:Copine-8 n=1 Tax=Collichthys lucidus TaxID=240159 RepID=A0A4U5URC9_COLLU|nr:Copine-8 [Collichthys lucidus]